MPGQTTYLNLHADSPNEFWAECGQPKRKIPILIGGGGHCKSVIDVIEQEAKFEIAGIVDKPVFNQ